MARGISLRKVLGYALCGVTLALMVACRADENITHLYKEKDSQDNTKSNPVIPPYLSRYPVSDSSVPIKGIGATPSCAELDDDVKTTSLPMSWGRYVLQASGAHVTEYWQGVPQNQLFARMTICVENVKVSYLLLSDLPLLDDLGSEFDYSSSSKTTDKYRTGLYYSSFRGTFFKQSPIFKKLGIDKFITWPEACRDIKFCDVTDAMDSLTSRQWRKWSRGFHHQFKMEPPAFIGRINYPSRQGLQTLLYTGTLQTQSDYPHLLTGQTSEGLRFVVILPPNYSERIAAPGEFINNVMRNFSSIITKEGM